MSNAINLIGNQYGRLTVIARAGSKYVGIKKRRKVPCWLCSCTCGNQKIVTSPNLKSGDTKSCGCLSSELKSKRLKFDPRMKHVEDFVDSNGHLKPEFEKNYHPTINKKPRITNVSGVTGVSCKNHSGKIIWIANLYYHGKYVLNKCFDNKKDAIAARIAAEEKYLQNYVK